MWGCEDVKIICVDVKMRRCEDVSLADHHYYEEPFAQTLSGKIKWDYMGFIAKS